MRRGNTLKDNKFRDDMMNTLVVATLSFFSPSFPLKSGGKVSLYGSGPPVIFSSGLFNSMPSWLYTEMFDNMKQNVTLVVAPPFLNDKRIDEIADTLGAESVGFFSHSSINPSVLTSPRLSRAVLCDPITLPQLSVVAGITSSVIQSSCPTLVLRAGRAYDDAEIPIPEMNSPKIEGDCTYKTIDDVGHPDILDDKWASLAEQTNLWPTVKNTKTPFHEWKLQPKGKDEFFQKLARSKYRKQVAEHAVNFFLDS
jgi:hypothetical protein